MDDPYLAALPDRRLKQWCAKQADRRAVDLSSLCTLWNCALPFVGGQDPFANLRTALSGDLRLDGLDGAGERA